MVKKIAVEEHCMCPGLEDYWAPTVADMPANKREAFLARLTDFGEMRLAAMDKAGIERAVLAVAGPGVQAERAQALEALIYLHPADPVTPAPVLDGYKGAAAGDLGMDVRDRLARFAHRVRRRVRSLPPRAARARPFGRNLAVPALALRQPH